MNTSIGSGLRERPVVLYLLLGLWAAGFASDLLSAAGIWLPRAYFGPGMQALLICLVCAFAEGAYRWDESPFGFRLSPRQGWLWWVKAALGFGILLAAILSTFAVLLFVVLNYGVPPAYSYINEPSRIAGVFLWMCIEAPLLEELIHRLALGSSLTALIGSRWTIVAGGLTFAMIHALGGNQSPENLLGGLILMWAFPKSETLLVPLALHAGGNACAFAWQVGYFYWNT